MKLSDSIAEYEKATQDFLATVNKLTENDLDRHQPEGWTPRQVIHHVADSEAQSYARLRRLIAEPGTLIQGYEEAVWGENETLGYTVRPIQSSVEVFKAVRASSLEILERLREDELSNSGVHSESGQYSIKTWLETYIKHPQEHADQIAKAL